MPQKILLLITNLGQGGAQRVFYDHSCLLSESEEVIEVVFDKQEAPNLYQSGNRMVSLDVKGGGGAINKIRNFYLRCKRLRDLVRQEAVGVCISHMDGANWVNTLSFSTTKKILVVHGTVLHDLNQNRLFQWVRTKVLIPSVYNRAEVTVAVSDAIAYELKHYCRVKNVVSIPNFFDIEEIKKKADEPLSTEEMELFSQPVLISSGRLAEQKKQEYLISVFKEVKKKVPSVKLVFLGDGELRQYLLNTVQNEDLHVYDPWSNKPLHADYDVYFLGYQKNPFKYLRHSRLFLFPSGWEGFPMALCEAMAAGVPVLSADCPTGPRQILSPETKKFVYDLRTAEWAPYGVLLPMYSESTFQREWITIIEELLLHEGKRTTLIEKALERVQDFSKEAGRKSWLTLIQQFS